ncbi:MAG: hypothetical protein HYZ79_07730 [Candidatus Melainabacteria bacterium]|nr:hypothetical protein [Candidatus Melainabacteria bacterium]
MKISSVTILPRNNGKQIIQIEVTPKEGEELSLTPIEQASAGILDDLPALGIYSRGRQLFEVLTQI